MRGIFDFESKRSPKTPFKLYENLKIKMSLLTEFNANRMKFGNFVGKILTPLWSKNRKFCSKFLLVGLEFWQESYFCMRKN
jgi:hypothetical protein